MWQLREMEREKGCARTAQLTQLEMRLDMQLLETCEPLKCRYFRLPQGVTYAKGATAAPTTTKTKCTCHTTTTHACTLPSFMPQLSKVSTHVCVCVGMCTCMCVLLVFAKHFAGIYLPVGQL